MLLGKYSISYHAIERYCERVLKLKKVVYSLAIKGIKKDLRTMNIKHIIYLNDEIHVFTKGYKEFIFKRKGKSLNLRTVIKRNFDDTQKEIQKCKQLATI